MSGLEALYWAQKYPEEVTAIIGLDMAVPQYYNNMKINIPFMKVASLAADIGVTRLILSLAESEAICRGTLSDSVSVIIRNDGYILINSYYVDSWQCIDYQLCSL